MDLRKFVFGLSASAIFALYGGFVMAEPVLTAEKVFQQTGFSEKEKQKVLGGGFVKKNIAETTEKMLGVGIAFIVSIDLETAKKNILSSRVFEMEGALAGGVIDLNNPEKSLAKMVFTDKEASEAVEFLKASPGSDFNLSKEEFAKLKVVSSGGNAVAVASKLYQAFLAERVKAYVARGIEGIAPYDRGDGEIVSAGGDVRAMTNAATLKETAPELFAAFAAYPKSQLAGTENLFTWAKFVVEDRPIFVLNHRMLISQAGAIFSLKRQYYVGHSYNASQTVSAGFSTEKGIIVFSGNRSTTDQIAGLMSGTRQKIARGMMHDKLIDQIEKVREVLAK